MPHHLTSYFNTLSIDSNDIMNAVINKNHSNLREIIKKTDINSQDENGNTCLHYIVKMASEAENTNDAKSSMWFQSVADYLVNHGAKTDLLNNEKIEQLASRNKVPTDEWITKKLWGFASEPPFLHHHAVELIIYIIYDVRNEHACCRKYFLHHTDDVGIFLTSSVEIIGDDVKMRMMM